MYDKTRNYFFALDMDSDTRRKALLLHNAGDDIFDIYDAMTDEQKGTGAMMDGIPSEYKKVKKSLEEYFTPKMNISFES